ncbi:hypothetical protein HW49_06225 [Porphyromonadaceae bacterium COT-184 OH4590]|nr:hypothetical protein HW49_06225 [Porphyromonadaceae bacterium COT-184 OH4590]
MLKIKPKLHTDTEPNQKPKNREHTKNIQYCKSKNNQQKTKPTDPTTDKMLPIKHPQRHTANSQPAKNQQNSPQSGQKGGQKISAKGRHKQNTVNQTKKEPKNRPDRQPANKTNRPKTRRTLTDPTTVKCYQSSIHNDTRQTHNTLKTNKTARRAGKERGAKNICRRQT